MGRVGNLIPHLNTPHQYKFQIIQQEIENATIHAKDASSALEAAGDHQNVIRALRDLGIRVYIIEFDSRSIFSDLRDIVEDASNADQSGTEINNRVLLYRDSAGRPFNIVVSGQSTGLAGSWSSTMISFSGLQANIALSILLRSFACCDRLV